MKVIFFLSSNKYFLLWVLKQREWRRWLNVITHFFILWHGPISQLIIQQKVEKSIFSTKPTDVIFQEIPMLRTTSKKFCAILISLERRSAYFLKHRAKKWLVKYVHLYLCHKWLSICKVFLLFCSCWTRIWQGLRCCRKLSPICQRKYDASYDVLKWFPDSKNWPLMHKLSKCVWQTYKRKSTVWPGKLISSKKTPKNSHF